MTGSVVAALSDADTAAMNAVLVAVRERDDAIKQALAVLARTPGADARHAYTRLTIAEDRYVEVLREEAPDAG